MGNTLRDIKRRIKSVKSTQQITRAMKMVAASKFRRAEAKVSHAHRFAASIEAVMIKLAPVLRRVEHPYLSAGAPRGKVLIVLMTSDKGLCGSFNSNLIKRTEQHAALLAEDGREVEFFSVGRKGHDYFKKRGRKIAYYEPNPRAGPGWGQVRTLAHEIDSLYTKRGFTEVDFIYSDFVNVTRHVPALKRVLPVEIPEESDISAEMENVIMEPATDELVLHALDRFVAIELLTALYINYASENGARMVAMDNATTAAGDMISALTLEYNKARQAAITRELLDIVGGAEAMK